MKNLIKKISFFVHLTIVYPFLFLSFLFNSVATYADDSELSRTTRSIIQAAVHDGQSFDNLKELTAGGHRLTGSSGAQLAVTWAQQKLTSYGFDKVWTQPVQVPRWERGSREEAFIITQDQKETPLKIAALGGSIGTGGSFLQAPVIEVDDLASAEKMGSRLKGKIVFYNHAMNPHSEDPFEEYSNTVGIRTSGAAVAAKYGAKGVVIRSLSTLPDDDHPHTGIMSYLPLVPKIPAAALSTHAANLLSKALTVDPNLKLKVFLSSENLGMVQSHNVIAELKGRSLPNEYVVTGGHLDSWDLSHGAHDDGAGVVQSIESLRVLKALGHRPKRSVRVVLFMAEEFGGHGSREYIRLAQQNSEKHIGAIESDSGAFAPLGISVSGSESAYLKAQSWQPYFSDIGPLKIEKGGSGADVEGLRQLGATPCGYTPDPTHYFDLHHSALDNIEAVDPLHLKQGAAVMAVMTYLMAELGF